MRMTCERCGETFSLRPTGRTPRFCSTRCRVAAHRAKAPNLPAEMTELERWTRRDGKRPITTSGRPASSTNPDTWATFADVNHSKAGDGFGIMLGNGLGCYDLDHCIEGGRLAAWAQAVLDDLEPVWVEVSMSGDGLHAFVHAPEGPGWRREGVEFYTRERFIAVTGTHYRR